MRSHEIFRLDELTGIRAHRSQPIDTMTDLVVYMKKLGFHMLGGGEYSLVFQNETRDDVVKVYNDECYDRFIAFCKAHPENPCLPRFFGNSVRLNDKARMIRIERLLPASFVEQEQAGIATLKKVAANPPKEFEQWDFTPEQQQFLDTLQELHAQKGNCWIDINPGNVMKRGHEQFVIVDPYAPDRDGWASHSR